MTTVTMPTTRREPAVNRVVLALLRSTAGRRLLPGLTALRFTGRRTGRPVTLPVSYAMSGTELIVLVGRSAGKLWWRNFRGGHPVEVLVDGRWRAGVGEAVTADRLEYPRLVAGYRARHHGVSAGVQDPVVRIRLLS